MTNPTLTGNTICITGGTGFVGGRLVEVAVQQLGARVRLVTRGGTTGRGLFRAVSQGVELAEGALTDAAAMAEVTKGCVAVFHCAYGADGSLEAQRKITVEGTRVLAAAAASNGVSRFVNLSTLVASGADCPEQVDEKFVSRRMWSWPYAKDKRDAEIALEQVSERCGFSVINLRPGPIYGPWGPAFAISPLTTLAAGRIALAGEGDGQTNAVYVDDVVQAMIRAALVSSTGFQTYFIVGPETVTWREFYSCFCEMLGVDRLVHLASEEHRKATRMNMISTACDIVGSGARALAGDPEFRTAVGRVPWTRSINGMFRKHRRETPQLPRFREPSANRDLPLVTIPPMMLPYFESHSRFSYEKARKQLGYDPQYRLREGMDLVEKWARWARLL